jgi:hypothetical protein
MDKKRILNRLIDIMVIGLCRNPLYSNDCASHKYLGVCSEYQLFLLNLTV